MLGSSEDSCGLAASMGLPYNFAYFINPNIRPDIFDHYRSQFRPGPNLDKPHSCLAIFTICADTEEEAIKLSSSRDLWYIRLLRGSPGPFPSVEEALSYDDYSPGELQAIAQSRDKRIVGTPEQVSAKLKSLVERFKLDELMLITITHDVNARRHSYQLIADAW
jgi:luciferase family oxidoreductase group 1